MDVFMGAVEFIQKFSVVSNNPTEIDRDHLLQKLKNLF